ncbi:MAG: aminotransferase class I/II-fold pyridoxal phosphate-dependent enzyme [Cyclobacteriaceae bacterium]|nr:aminotransferase class I/II-fold pyridoxal phosphate-dependent enzyme [Cyclobacteriaceae bacterium]
MSAWKNFETNAIRTQAERSHQREHSAPIYATSSFVFDDAEQARALFAGEQEGNIYTRFSNPNNDEFIDKMCLLEGTEDGMAMASGMAAMFVSMAAFLNQGDHLLICRSIFGSTHQITTQLLPRWGISHTYVDIQQPEAWEKEIRKNTRMIFLETPSNPGLDIIDLELVGDIAKKHGLLFNVDNCFATPYLQNPAKYGADLITHSATKFIDGQGRVIGGAILGTKASIEKVRFFARHTGPAMSPFNSWILSKSLETLAVRMDKHCENALNLAMHLEKHQDVLLVKYPFLPSHPNVEIAKKQMKLGGGMVSFELKGGIDQGRKFLDSLKMISFSANLGDTRSIAAHPASTTHSKLSSEERASVGITDGLIRVSVGLEHVSDIIADIEQAMEASKK